MGINNRFCVSPYYITSQLLPVWHGQMALFNKPFVRSFILSVPPTPHPICIFCFLPSQSLYLSSFFYVCWTLPELLCQYSSLSCGGLGGTALFVCVWRQAGVGVGGVQGIQYYHCIIILFEVLMGTFFFYAFLKCGMLTLISEIQHHRNDQYSYSYQWTGLSTAWCQKYLRVT